WALALAAVAVSAHLGYRLVGPLPHVEDGIAYLYQAKTFLTGGFYQPAPAVPGGFDARFAWVFMDDAGRSYGIFPPGWPLLLAAGVWLGVPWIINPLLCGLAVLLLWRLLRAIDGPAVAAASCLLLLTSPFFLLQGASFLSHPATLLWILVALNGALGVETTGSRPAVVPALLLGLGVGLTLATRYVEGLLLGLVLGSYLLAAVARRRVVLAALPLALLGLAPGLSLALVDNAVKTGSPWVTPVERWYTVEHGAPLNRPGFGPRVGLEWDHSLGPGHSLFEGLWTTLCSRASGTPTTTSSN
ncbi:MAG: glycosyltransferase family 39 protein, partial [Armatimonadetes bacterium]|nr:glycosyltransferase family 39 protein [Armatimonadota bacterium]